MNEIDQRSPKPTTRMMRQLAVALIAVGAAGLICSVFLAANGTDDGPLFWVADVVSRALTLGILLLAALWSGWLRGGGDWQGRRDV